MKNSSQHSPQKQNPETPAPQGLIQNGLSEVKKFIEAQPYAAVGIGAVAGYFLVGALLPTKSKQ
ncbi:MAG: hypothetical protein ABIR96_03240 [Bdellovibrionota bacterium]